MSDDARKPPQQRRPSEPEALLADLKSIRDLLDVDLRKPLDDDIPVLREMVGETARREVQTDLFDARGFADRLLDESWQQQSDAILASARRTADALTAKLSPGADASARERLEARLATELPPLLEQVVGEAIDELQTRLLTVLRNEVTRLTRDTLTAADSQQDANDSTSHD